MIYYPLSTLMLGQLNVEIMGRGYAWLDTASFISTLQKRQGLQVCCPEEIAFAQKCIDARGFFFESFHQRDLLAALALALLTEGLQFVAIDRHPRWVDVGIDLAGTGLGLMVGWLIGLYSGHRDAL